MTRELLQQALDALNLPSMKTQAMLAQKDKAIAALKAALVQPVPPQREWVGLTDEEIHDTPGYQETREMYRFALAIEAKLREKNV